MQPTTETSQCEAFCLYILVYSLSSVCAVRPNMGFCDMYVTLVVLVMMCANLCRMDIPH